MKTKTTILWLLLLVTVTTGIYFYSSQTKSEAGIQNISPNLGGISGSIGQNTGTTGTGGATATGSAILDATGTGGATATTTDASAKSGGLVKCKDLVSCFAELYDLALTIIPIIVLIIIIYAGYLYISSLGSESKVTEARSLITAALTGLIIILIIPLILKLLGLADVS